MPRPRADPAAGRALEVTDLYSKLATVIAPLFHRDRAGWIVVMRHAISLNATFYNTHRMVQQYVTNAYL